MNYIVNIVRILIKSTVIGLVKWEKIKEGKFKTIVNSLSILLFEEKREIDVKKFLSSKKKKEMRGCYIMKIEDSNGNSEEIIESVGKDPDFAPIPILFLLFYEIRYSVEKMKSSTLLQKESSTLLQKELYRSLMKILKI